MRQHAHHVLAEALEHVLEQLEGLALVLVERVALAVAAQVDALAQVVERQQVVLPGLVQ